MRRDRLSAFARIRIFLAISSLAFLAGLFCARGLAQEKALPPNLRNPLPTVALKDGRTIHNVIIVSFGSSAVMAKWEGGRGTLGYDLLPDEIRNAALQLRREASQSTNPKDTGQARVEQVTQVPKSMTLTAARHGFSTHLLRLESIGERPDRPPPRVLDLVSYPGPLGPMAAYVSSSPNDGKRRPAIIWLVGGSSNSISSVAWTPASPDNDQSASGFRRAGIIMMYPSLRGGNNSPGYHEKFFGEVDDVIAAANYLSQLNYVDTQRIYLGGHSTGGTLALLVAESSNQFHAVYSLGPVGDMLAYEQDALPFDASNSNECRLRSPALWLDSIHVPTFVFEGTESPSNIGQLRTMAQLNRNPLVKFREVSGGTHFTIVAQLVREIAQQIQSDNGQ
jgi:pimeloyl-ACP methyl ester carboxylesterase